jgi:DNA primase
VATPVAWEELGTGITPAHFTLLNIRRRLSSLAADPWEGMAATRQKLPKT